MTTSELFWRETEFEARRHRVVRGLVALFAAGAGGMALCLLARLWAPQVFDLCVQLFVVGTAAAGLWAWLNLRRHWRCPVCDVRWDSQDAFAGRAWNHCASCGEALRAVTVPGPGARREACLALEPLSRHEAVARFRHRRRQSRIATAAAALLGAVAFVAVQTQGWGEWAEQGVVAVFAGLVTAAAVLGARCPRCGSGVFREGKHCAHCGFTVTTEG